MDRRTMQHQMRTAARRGLRMRRVWKRAVRMKSSSRWRRRMKVVHQMVVIWGMETWQMLQNTQMLQQAMRERRTKVSKREATAKGSSCCRRLCFQPR
jgi:hypothetical protein